MDPVRFWPHGTRTKWLLFKLATERWIADVRRAMNAR